jgi:outer membrane lipoprotein carrier protein
MKQILFQNAIRHPERSEGSPRSVLYSFWRYSWRSLVSLGMTWGGMFVLFSFSSSVWAYDAKADFQNKFHAIRTMQATFNQVIYVKTRATSKTSGKMALARPSKFRWETLKPVSQLVIADGSRLWIYDEDLEQVTVRRQSQTIQSSAGLFLSDNDSHLLESFDVTVKKIENFTYFDLRSKSNRADFKHVVFQFEDKLLRGMELFDALGQRTVVSFQKITMNQPVLSQSFKFTPPKGVDVIDEGDARD